MVRVYTDPAFLVLAISPSPIAGTVFRSEACSIMPWTNALLLATSFSSGCAPLYFHLSCKCTCTLVSVTMVKSGLSSSHALRSEPRRSGPLEPPWYRRLDDLFAGHEVVPGRWRAASSRATCFLAVRGHRHVHEKLPDPRRLRVWRAGRGRAPAELYAKRRLPTWENKFDRHLEYIERGEHRVRPPSRRPQNRLAATTQYWETRSGPVLGGYVVDAEPVTDVDAYVAELRAVLPGEHAALPITVLNFAGGGLLPRPVVV